jgi:hypothetical protein
MAAEDDTTRTDRKYQSHTERETVEHYRFNSVH